MSRTSHRTQLSINKPITILQRNKNLQQINLEKKLCASLYSLGDAQKVILSKDYFIAIDTIIKVKNFLEGEKFSCPFCKKEREIINRNNEKNMVAVIIFLIIRLHPMCKLLCFLHEYFISRWNSLKASLLIRLGNEFYAS